MAIEQHTGPFEYYQDSGTGRMQLDEMTLIISTQLVGHGDNLPQLEARTYISDLESELIVDFNSITRPFLLAVVNALGTEVCDEECKTLNNLRTDYPDTPVWVLSKQNPKELSQLASQLGLTYDVASITSNAAMKLGVELQPHRGSFPGWVDWPLRSLFVVKSGKILYAERLNDQGEQPNYAAAMAVALASR